MDNKTARKRLAQFHILLICCVLLTAISIGCLLAAAIITDNAYQKYIAVSTATNMDTRLLSYHQAISLCPDRADAYLLLLDSYSEDGVFTKAESEDFLAVYNNNHTQLPKDANYGKLHAQAGLLYINAYEDTSTVRLRMALPFFEIAVITIEDHSEEQIAVNCYANIGKYYRDYIWTTGVKEVSPLEMTNLLADIGATLDAFAESTASDAVYNKLGFSVAVCNLLYDQRDILAATVPEDTVVDVLDLLYLSLPDENSLQSERSRQIVQELNTNENMYYSMILRAYERTGDI